jgi:hypothetical protein
MGIDDRTAIGELRNTIEHLADRLAFRASSPRELDSDLIRIAQGSALALAHQLSRTLEHARTEWIAPV